jgi:hypothetical protein
MFVIIHRPPATRILRIIHETIAVVIDAVAAPIIVFVGIARSVAPRSIGVIGFPVVVIIAAVIAFGPVGVAFRRVVRVAASGIPQVYQAVPIVIDAVLALDVALRMYGREREKREESERAQKDERDGSAGVRMRRF